MNSKVNYSHLLDTGGAFEGALLDLHNLVPAHVQHLQTWNPKYLFIKLWLNTTNIFIQECKIVFEVRASMDDSPGIAQFILDRISRAFRVNRLGENPIYVTFITLRRIYTQGPSKLKSLLKTLISFVRCGPLKGLSTSKFQVFSVAG